MEVFRKELKAALYEKARVWCDEDIVGGTDWKGSLAKELRCADVVLILATSDYLIPLGAGKSCNRSITSFGKEDQECLLGPAEALCMGTDRACCVSMQTICTAKRTKRDSGEIDREREIIDIVREIASGVESIANSLDSKDELRAVDHWRPSLQRA